MKQFYYCLFLSLLHFTLLAQESNFPHRTQYSDLTYITIEQLKSSLQVSLVVDVRSELEFNTAHIINAWNVPFSNRGFLV
ncbi:MAG: rhodanese-like domain-containing protein, partial [Alteromonadales bacterium]|nr:rhodanese-like domain-containing protein [Alteromonadales bacterium]